MRKWFERLAALTSGVLFSWLLLEVGLRVAFTGLPNPVQIMLRDVKRVPWANERLLPEQVWFADDTYQLAIRPNLDNELQYPDPNVGFHVSTKNFIDPASQVGFRVPSIDWEPTWPVDAVVVGDSFSFCYVEYDDCWVRRLETDYGLSVVNLGMVATGSISHFNALMTFGLPYQPETVIWQWYGNDFNDDYGFMVDSGEILVEVAENSAESGAPVNWFWKQNSVVYVLGRTVSEGLRNDDLANEIKFADPYVGQIGNAEFSYGQSYILDAFDLSNVKNRIGRDRSMQAILEAKTRLDEAGIELLIVLMPAKEDVYRDVVSAELSPAQLTSLQQGRLEMLAFCEAEQLDCVDVYPALKNEADAGGLVFIPDDSHMNEAGNFVTAAAISDAIGK